MAYGTVGDLAVAGRLLSPEAQGKILQNKNVLRVSETTHSRDFCANLFESKPPQVIVVDAGFDLELIGRETPERCLLRWRAVYTQRGEEGLKSD
jgi:hypothetical protein